MSPDCEIFINQELYHLPEICAGKKVVDIGCGYGANRPIVEAAGGEWTGVEPFESGAATVIGDAENLPFQDATFDLAIMDAVLEHIPDVGKAFSEVARVLKPGGLFIGYVAYMECFHEISYSHLSFKALEHYSKINGMKLEKISGGRRFGIDYHLRILFHPLPFGFLRPVIAASMRFIFRLKSELMYLKYRFSDKQSRAEAGNKATLFYQFECLRQSNGFQHIIRKL